jgi:ribonuclease P protein subunit POP4
MKITPDIIRYEFIGTQAKIAQSVHLGYIGLAGPVIAETKNTLTLIHQGQPKSVIKDLATFDFSFDDGTTVEVDGKLLVGRSEDRLKKGIKRLW